MSELCAEISGGRGRRTALHSLPFSLSLSIFITLALTISASLPLAFFFGYQLATFSSPLPPLALSLSLSVAFSPRPPYRFESSLDVDALAPRHSGIGQTVSSAAPARDVHSLATQVPEGLCYHQDGVMGQS